MRNSHRIPLVVIAAATVVLNGLGHVPSQSAPPAPVRDGLSEAGAAASCWEIKQNDPNAPDGTYWLQTPTMNAPGRFFCDQTSDGGGWVLIGRGTDGWETWSQGKGAPSALAKRERRPADGTVQLSHEAVNGLLGSTPVSELPDGMRVVRAYNGRGTSWQTIKMRLPKMADFVWPFKSAHPVVYSIDGGEWTTGEPIWSKFGDDLAWGMVDMTATATSKYRVGFGYGPGALLNADTSDTSFFRKAGFTVEPYAEVYLRPQLRSDDAYARIADSGTPAQAVAPTVSEYAAPMKWGVTGNLNGSYAEGNAQVQAFEQVGSTMYVGGNFTGVARAGSTKAQTSALAGFDASSGEWNGQSFAFNNQVKDLVELPGARLLAVGDFTRVNGEEHVGTVVIDTATGAIDSSWTLRLRNALRSGAVSVKAARVAGQHIYLGGLFTHASSNGGRSAYARGAVRLSLSGEPDRSWNPEFNGSVVAFDVDEAGGYFYAGGHFTRAQRGAAPYAARVSTAAGAALDSSWTFEPSYFDGMYQQGVALTGGRVYFGGSQHSLFGYDTATMTRTSGSIAMQNGGDMQAVTSAGNGVVYASCHCSDFVFQDAYRYYELGTSWTRADEIRWAGAWDGATGRQLGWTPYRLASARSTGAWALEADDSGSLWVGGDFTRSFTSKSANQWAGGFARFAPRQAPPAAPANLASSGAGDGKAALTWDAVAGAASYEVLRDDRTVATVRGTSASVPMGGENRFFVRAVGASGSRGASTPVLRVAADGAQAPAEPGSSLVGDAAQWRYLWKDSAPDQAWASASYDDSAWTTGTAPIGYGGKGLNTVLKPGAPASRPITLYGRTAFTIKDLSKTGGVEVSFVADDGAVAYINGVEIGRQRLDDGDVSYGTRASSALSTDAARADRQTVQVPASALVEGVNVLAVEEHVNYRNAPSLTLSATVTAIPAGAYVPPIPSPPRRGAPPAQSGGEPQDPPADEPLKPLDASHVNFGKALFSGEQWSYWTDAKAPDAAWASTADLSKWQHGASPLGWGDAGAGTDFGAAKRPTTAYFARDVKFGPMPENGTLTLHVRADDGAVIYVNGTEVARVRMPSGTVTPRTKASNGVTVSEAADAMVEVVVPGKLLTSEITRIAVEEHSAGASDPSLTFDMYVTLER